MLKTKLRQSNLTWPFVFWNNALKSFKFIGYRGPNVFNKLEISEIKLSKITDRLLWDVEPLLSYLPIYPHNFKVAFLAAVIAQWIRLSLPY